MPNLEVQRERNARRELLMQLPEISRKKREQGQELLSEADRLTTSLVCFDFDAAGRLELTSDPKLDAALRLSLERGGFDGKAQLESYPIIYAKLVSLEKKLAEYEGGLMLADMTSQDRDPMALSFCLLQVPEDAELEIVAEQRGARSLPFNIRVRARILILGDSTRLLRKMRFGSEYEATQSGRCVRLADHRPLACEPIETTFELVNLVHPNLGTYHVKLAGIIPGQQAIFDHFRSWKNYLDEMYPPNSHSKEELFDFLDEFRSEMVEFARP